MTGETPQNYREHPAVTLSGVIITLNAARHLDQVLAALSQVADEVVVVDCGSTDATQDIALRHGARFFHHPWQGYAAQKNYANTQARGSYILSLDADEIPDAKLLQALKGEKAKGFTGVYRINRLPFWCGRPVKHSGWHPDWKIRLFPRHQAHWTGGPVHETLWHEPTLPVHNLPGYLYHFTYESLSEHRARTRQYARLAAQRLASLPRSALYAGLLLKPPIKFLRHFFLKKGFLDGRAGWYIACISALGVVWRFREALRLKNMSKTCQETPDRGS
jgi:glycosyltransferase involved in cell wall biosynthesis